MKLGILVGLTAAIGIAGCTTGIVAPIHKNVRATGIEAKSLLISAQQGNGAVKPQSSPSIEHVDGLWLPTRKMADVTAQVSKKDAIKRRLSVNREFRTIQDVAEKVTLLTGIPVIISPDAALPPQSQQAQQPGAIGALGGIGMPSPIGSMPQLPPMGMEMGANSITVPSLTPTFGTVSLVYDGMLSGFLDVAAARFGVSWEWTGSGINIFRYTTKTFRIVALPGDTTLKNTISNQTGGTSGAAGGSSSSSAVSFSGLSVWTAIGDSIKGMLSQSGKVTVTAATGTVTVTDTPQIMEQVEKFIDGQNASLGKQVTVNVRVLSVDLTDTDQYGINWDLLYSSLSGNYGVGLANAFSANPNASNLALKILGVTGNGRAKKLAGSQAIISALTTQGLVRQITSASLTTLNNQPAPLQVGRQTSYLASSTTTLTQGVGATTTLEPGLITTGFSMSLVPHMLDKGKLMLQFAIDISSLLNLNEITSGNSTIQTPEIDTRNFLQRVMMNTGETLVLTGFEQSTSNATSKGVGNANNVALGGGVNGNSERSILVILIQPVVGDD